MARRGFPAVLSVLLLAVATPAAALGVLEVRGERLTLRVDAVSLRAVLSRLAADAGIAFVMKGGTDETVTADLVNVPLGEALQRLLGGWNTLFVYDRSRAAPSAVYLLGPRTGPVVAAAVGEGEARPTDSSRPEDREGAAAAESFEDRALRKIDALEEELGAELPPALGRLRDLLDDPDPIVRITALQRLTGPRDAVIDALAAALVDTDLLVRSAAQQMVLNRGTDEHAVEQVITRASDEDKERLRLLLGAAITR